MKIYEVYVTALNCEGNYAGKERLAVFQNKRNADDYIKSWKRLWNLHSDPEDPAYGLSPCYLDHEPEPTLLETETND